MRISGTRWLMAPLRRLAASTETFQEPADLLRRGKLAPEFSGEASDDAIGRYPDGPVGVTQGIFDDGPPLLFADGGDTLVDAGSAAVALLGGWSPSIWRCSLLPPQG